MATPQELYQELQKKRINASAPDLANALHDLIGSVFSKPDRIGYELIQNADDAAETDEINREVEFYVLQDYILICHNGKHFEENDVRALCRYGAHEEENNEAIHDAQTNLKKTGYKGIGFKSVFRISDEVSIFSRDYTFKFDKSHWNTKVPWQIMPIAASIADYPSEIVNKIDTTKVSFLIKLNELENRDTIAGSLENILNSYKIILFLRHVKQLAVYKQENEQINLRRQILRTNADTNKFNIKVHIPNQEGHKTYWRIDKFSFDIPAVIRESIQHEDERICPKKMKEAKELEISFAAKCKEDGTVIPVTAGEGLLYSFLPTQIQRHFPFVINALFIMNAERTIVKGSRDTPRCLWNEFLMEQIGYFQFQWYQKMQDDEILKYEFPKLLKKYAANTNDSLNRGFNKGVERGKQAFAFVPVLEEAAPQKIYQTIVDSTHISFKSAQSNMVKERMGQDDYIADPNIQKIEKIIPFGAKEFNIEKLREAIRQTNAFIAPEANGKLIGFFHKRIDELEGNERREWNRELRKTHFVLSQEEALKMPGEVYFPEHTDKLPFDLSMSYIHSIVYSDTIQPNTPLREWLQRLGISYPKPLEIIRKGVFALLEAGQVDNQNIVPITRYIFQHYQQLNDTEIGFLSQKLPILTKQNSLLEARRCHLSDEYHPKLSLEEVLFTEDIFVSETYLPENTVALRLKKEAELTDGNTQAYTDIQSWNNFFIRLGVQQEVELKLVENYFQFPNTQIDRYPAFKEYIQPYFPAYNHQAGHGLQNFLNPKYLKKTIDNPAFAAAYWTILFQAKKWKELLQTSRKCKFNHTGGSTAIPNYFNFMVEEKNCFPATDGNCYPTIAITSKALEHIVGEDAPISKFDIEPDKEAFLKIRSQINIENCLEFLRGIATKESIDKERISNIYNYIAEQRFTKEQLEQIDFFGDDFPILSVSNTFQAKSKLYYLDLPRFAERVDSADFIFLDIPSDNTKALCQLFDIKTIELSMLKLSKDAADQPDSSLKEAWEKVIPYISCVLAKASGKAVEDEQQRLEAITEDTTFTSCKKLELVYHNEANQEIYNKEIRSWLDDNEINYVAPWNESRNKFDLMEVLTTYFGLEKVEKEANLFIDLDSQHIIEWLDEHGYDVSSFDIEADLIEEEEEEIEEEGEITILVPKKNKDRITSPPIDEPEPTSYPPRKSEFEREVESLIDTIDNSPWSSNVGSLQQLLLGIDNSENRQKLSNIVAKIKLGLQLGEKDDGSSDYNYLRTGENDYKVHSARGPYAYIHPKEIIGMHEKGIKMAIDWGNDEISIYDTPLDLLNKNDIQLLRYSGEQSLDDLLAFCAGNSAASRHLIYIDDTVKGDTNDNILKLLGPQDEY